MADVKSAIKGYLGDTRSPMQRMLAMQMASLRGNEEENLNNILKKYPGMSNDLAIAMVRQGLTADTPGLGKITTIDGLAALKNDKVK